jgi:hypothetical protein
MMQHQYDIDVLYHNLYYFLQFLIDVLTLIPTVELKAINTGNEDVKIKIHQQLSYDYPFKVNTMKPSKQSVSELKRQLETEESNTNY